MVRVSSRESALADKVAKHIGSRRFIIAQSTFLALWLVLNLGLPVKYRWDPQPFILLNLMLSFQAAFTGPVLLMAANRQSEIDRRRDIEHFLMDVHENEVIEEIATRVKTLTDSEEA